MKNTHYLSSLLLAAGIFGLASQAQAAVSVTHTGDTVVAPGGQFKPEVSISFDAPYEMVHMNLALDYDPSKLVLNFAGSLINFGGVDYSYGNFIAALAAEKLATSGDFDFIESNVAGQFALDAGYLLFGSYTLTGSIVLKPVFDMSPGFASGSSTVTISKLQFDDVNFNSDVLADSSQPLDYPPIDMTVTAVPEPETWLMMLGGLGLLAIRRIGQRA